MRGNGIDRLKKLEESHAARNRLDLALSDTLQHAVDHAERATMLRDAMAMAITVADVQAVTKVLIKAAKRGESWAVKEFFERAVGRVAQSVDVDVKVAPIKLYSQIDPARV